MNGDWVQDLNSSGAEFLIGGDIEKARGIFEKAASYLPKGESIDCLYPSSKIANMAVLCRDCPAFFQRLKLKESSFVMEDFTQVASPSLRVFKELFVLCTVRRPNHTMFYWASIAASVHFNTGLSYHISYLQSKEGSNKAYASKAMEHYSASLQSLQHMHLRREGSLCFELLEYALCNNIAHLFNCELRPAETRYWLQFIRDGLLSLRFSLPRADLLMERGFDKDTVAFFSLNVFFSTRQLFCLPAAAA